MCDYYNRPKDAALPCTHRPWDIRCDTYGPPRAVAGLRRECCGASEKHLQAELNLAGTSAWLVITPICPELRF